jgi:hypothetical protein
MKSTLLEEMRNLNLPTEYRLLFLTALRRHRRLLAVTKAFHVEANLGVYPSVFDDGDAVIGHAIVDYLWIISISGYWAGGEVILAGIHYLKRLGQPDVTHGVLLRPQSAMDYTQFIGERPFRYVEFDSNIDQVAQAIGHLNLFEPPDKHSGIYDGRPRPSLHIYLWNANGDREINHSVGTEDCTGSRRSKPFLPEGYLNLSDL